MRSLPRFNLLLVLAALAMVAAVLTGVAIAQGGGGDDAIWGCVLDTNGRLRVVDGPDDCNARETPLSWSQTGPTGRDGEPCTVSEADDTITISCADGTEVSFDVPLAPNVAADVVVVGVPKYGIRPLLVSFSAAAHGNPPFAYEWDFGDGSTASTEQAPQHTYVDGGLFAATVTVTDADGDVATGAVDIVVEGYAVETFAAYHEPGRGHVWMAFDNSGNLYVSHKYEQSIWKITPDAGASKWVSGYEVRGIVWAGGTDYGNRFLVPNGRTPDGRVYGITPGGAVATFALFNPPRHCPQPLAIAPEGPFGGLLYVATGCQDRTYTVTPDGSVSLFADVPGWTDGGGPTEIAFDRTGDYGGLMYMVTGFSLASGNRSKSGLFSVTPAGVATRFTSELDHFWRLEIDDLGSFDHKMIALGEVEWDTEGAIWEIEPDGSVAQMPIYSLTGLQDLIIGPDGAMYVATYSDVDGNITISRIPPRCLNRGGAWRCLEPEPDSG